MPEPEVEPVLAGVTAFCAGAVVLCTGMLPKRRNELPLRVVVDVPVVVVPLPRTGVPVVALPRTGVAVVAPPRMVDVPPTPVALVGMGARSVDELRAEDAPPRTVDAPPRDEDPPRADETPPMVAPPPLVGLTP